MVWYEREAECQLRDSSPYMGVTYGRRVTTRRVEHGKETENLPISIAFLDRNSK
jgi:hypothetical protein